ncbi:MAG: hypothetical protein GY754_17520 [bacterium]|nr:hypothetical protein [bacterium]
MYIDTTIHINVKLLEEVEAAAKQLNLYRAKSKQMSRSDIIILLLDKVRERKEISLEMFKQIKYQFRDLACNWKRIHVYPEVEKYETWLDLRKISKRSVSLIIAIAINEHLDQLIKELSSTEKPGKSDSYPSDYLFLARGTGGIQKFVIYWGFPEEIHLEEHFT